MSTRDAAGHRDRSERSAGSHPVQLDRSPDRWEWRRKIRADPQKALVYRAAIAVLGLLLVLLGAATGPLPGPGGIPLVLLGLAVWASEFRWAHRLMQWFKHQLQTFRGWGRSRQLVAWAVFFACVDVICYGYLLATGVPIWLPNPAADWLGRLPGVE